MAQNLQISGKAVDEKDDSELVGASVLLIAIPDSTQSQLSLTDLEGKFKFSNLHAGKYRIRITYIGSQSFFKFVNLSDQNVDLGKLKIKSMLTSLKEVRVEEKAIRAEQKGDTTQYNANAFKTNPNATLEDLASKMPGITVENGTVKAHGEEVKKILIDGKEYFGDDVNTALKNLPAEVVDKIQVFDKLSDQSQLTGFNDGNTIKTINIITKQGKSNGQFGKIYGGYGTDFINNRYQAGTSLNLFSSKRKISIISQTNNINQQNFSTQDLAGIFPQQSGGHGGGMGGRGMGGGGGMGRPPGYQNEADNFMVSSLGGITTTHAAGINYSESWGKKLTITSSYFFNKSINRNEIELERNYFNKELSGQIYTENSNSKKDNLNHRGNLRIEYNPDTLHTILFTPKFNFQRAVTSSDSYGNNAIAASNLNNTTTDNSTYVKAYNYSAELLYQQKFYKKGRTLSIGATTQGTNKMGNSTLISQNNFYQNSDTNEVVLDQIGRNVINTLTMGANLGYTEPIGQKSIVEINYNPAITWNASDKNTYKLTPDSVIISSLDSLLSSQFSNTYSVQKFRFNYRLRGEKVNFMLGAAYQYAELKGLQVFPNQENTFRTFSNILPMAMMMIQFSKKANWRLFYRSSTNPPSITQLQNVVDNSNPLVLSIGNPFLKQDFTHFIGSRFSYANTEKGTNFFLFGTISTTYDFIGNSTFIASSDTILQSGIQLFRGTRVTSPANLGSYVNGKLFLNYGWPLSLIKCNLNLNAGFSYGQTPSLINSLKNLARSFSPTAGFVLSSNISEKIDFTLSLTSSYYRVENTLLQTQNSNYYIQTSLFRFNWQFWKGFVVSSEVNHSLYSGLGTAFNTSFFLWNSGLAYKFLKGQNAELRLSVFDLINQNQSVSRNLSDTYLENSRNLVLNRYYMLTFTYYLKKLNSGGQNEKKKKLKDQGPR